MKLILIFASILMSFNAYSQSFNLLWSKSNNITVNDDRARQNAVDSSGIYIVGNDYTPFNNQWRIEKHDLYTGALIWAQTTNPSVGNDYPNDVVVFKSALYISGYENISGTDYRWRLEKRNPSTGALIWAQFSNPSAGGDIGFGVFANDSGVFMSGADYASGKNGWRLERRDLVSGNLIWSRTVNPLTTGVGAQAFRVVANDSAVFACGYEFTPNSAQWRIEKREISSGSLIWVKQKDFSITAYDYAYDMAIDSSGIYVIGNDFSLGGTNNQWHIEKLSLFNGDTLWTQVSNPSPNNEIALAVALDSHYLYIGGSQDSLGGNPGWRLEKRDLSSGALMCSLSTNPSALNGDAIAGICADETGVYLSGQNVVGSGTGNYEWYFQKYTLCVLDSLPIAAFSVSDYSICIGDCINYADSSLANPAHTFWKFQGATTASSTLANPSAICYPNSGTYAATLYAANGAGLDTLTQFILVNALPVVSLSLNPDTVCINATPYLLSGGYPAGGLYSGNGVFNGAVFTPPDSTGIGLRQIVYTFSDTSGCISSDSAALYVDLCTSIKNREAEQLALIFPNPFSVSTSIRYSQKLEEATLLVYNTYGQLVKQITNVSGKIVELSAANLPTGLYTLQTLQKNKILRTDKFQIMEN